MEIRQLRYFIAVADTLNFSRAASSVYLSQSALSRQIADLEQEVGVPLFHRSTRQVELTEAGRALQHSAKELISRWEKMLPEVRNQVSEQHRALTLTVGTDARALSTNDRRIKVTEMLFELRRQHPGLRVLMRNCDYSEILKGLGDKTLDCALVLDRELETRGDILQDLYDQEEMVLVFRSANSHKNGDFAEVISNRGLILVDQEPQGLYHIIRILSDLKLEPQIRFCPSLNDMTMTVEAGESATILPKSVVEKLNNPNLTTLQLPTEYAKLQLVLLRPRNHNNSILEEFRLRCQELLSTKTAIHQPE